MQNMRVVQSKKRPVRGPGVMHYTWPAYGARNSLGRHGGREGQDWFKSKPSKWSTCSRRCRCRRVNARRSVDGSRSIISRISAQRRGMTARDGTRRVSRYRAFVEFYGESRFDDDARYIRQTFAYFSIKCIQKINVKFM
ncbi:hypothetical protein ALC57_09167 [Trachymyrmex cornetzi]|uniref:Uncharacterized protein n=1 Tax=Trachymyrmex cornetzi TaxID=471704 RepID=A0A195E0L6_9HYME|nr:hypothetical protein ALC57_09167 [Trachymyrmex cornetzi]